LAVQLNCSPLQQANTPEISEMRGQSQDYVNQYVDTALRPMQIICPTMDAIGNDRQTRMVGRQG
jgi:hypothetical protein